MNGLPERVPNGDFAAGRLGGLPDGWHAAAARPVLAPEFRLERHEGRQLLLAGGGGNPECTGYVWAPVRLRLGKTYLFRAVFRRSSDLDPHRHLLFRAVGPGAKDGIFSFHRLGGDWIEGGATVCWPGEGEVEGQVEVFFRFSAHGKAWISSVSLVETEATGPRWVRVACTQGRPDLNGCARALDLAGQSGADLALMSEWMQDEFITEPVPGPSTELMSRMARQHRMYVAGGIVRRVDAPDRVYNTCVLHDRQGEVLGMYDKIHPYSPENNELGVTPGRSAPVFCTDFGRVGTIICYDSWFTDVCQLLALKGAEIVLFPNAGYQPEFLYARAGDNAVRIVCSSWNCPYAIHDTLGRNILRADEFHTAPSPAMRTFADVQELEVPGSPLRLLLASLDLNCSPSPAYNGGTMASAPGGRRNRREQLYDLEDDIRREIDRWWDE